MDGSRHRVTAALAACALALAPVSGGVHLATVAHRVCAEHGGAVVHGEHAHADLTGHNTAEPGPVGLGSDSPHPPHDHGCLALSSLWSQPLLPDARTPIRALSSPIRLRSPSPRSASYRDILAWAPKQSPPSALSA